MPKINTAFGFGFVLISKTTGAPLAGETVTAYRSVEGGAQEAAGGTVSDLGNGHYWYSGVADDLSGVSTSFLFTSPNAIPVQVTIETAAKLVSELEDPTPETLANAVWAALSSVDDPNTRAAQLNAVAANLARLAALLEERPAGGGERFVSGALEAAPVTSAQDVADAAAPVIATALGGSLAAEVDDLLSANHGAGSWLSDGSPLGTGGTLIPIRLTATDGTPIRGAEVWITFDPDGTDPATGVLELTDETGLTHALLNLGDTYYLWSRGGNGAPIHGVEFTATLD